MKKKSHLFYLFKYLNNDFKKQVQIETNSMHV